VRTPLVEARGEGESFTGGQNTQNSILMCQAGGAKKKAATDLSGKDKRSMSELLTLYLAHVKAPWLGGDCGDVLHGGGTMRKEG